MKGLSALVGESPLKKILSQSARSLSSKPWWRVIIRLSLSPRLNHPQKRRDGCASIACPRIEALSKSHLPGEALFQS